MLAYNAHIRIYHGPIHFWWHKLLGVHVCRSLEGTYISLWIMRETVSVVSVSMKLPEREVCTLPLHPFTSQLSADCPWWCHWWSSACQIWCSSFRHFPPWILCSAEQCAGPPGACVIFTSLASLSNVSSCLSGVSLCLSLSLVSHPSPPHLTSEYYHFWGTVSALEMLYVQRVNSNLTTLGLSTSVFQEEYYNELVSFSVLRVGRGNGTVRSFDQTIRCSLTSSGLCSNTVFLIKMSRLI